MIVTQVKTENEEKHLSQYKFNLCLLAEDDKKRAEVSPDIRELRDKLEPFIYTTQLEGSDIILVYATNEEWSWNKLLMLRSEPEHFLKPILILLEEKNEALSCLADEILIWPTSNAKLAYKLQHLFEISSSARGLAEIPETLGEIGLRKILLLRYLYTRPNYKLQPMRNFLSCIGYTYPIAQSLFNVDLGEELTFIENLEEAQLLNSKLIDKINICPFCEHTHINYRELCPQCRSVNVNEESTIHHFRCAYVGRASEFQRGFKLECPKCSHELKHIGVDYDKPAEVLWCNDCYHNFSEPQLHCSCLVCGRTFAPDDAFIKHINEHTLTQDGYRAAEEGVLPGFGLINILKKELGFYKYEVFVEYLRLEILRCRRYKYKSTFAKFNLDSASKAFGEASLKHSRKLRNDFAAIITATFRTTDLFTDVSNGEIMIIFTNTDTERVIIAFTRLNDSLRSLLKNEVEIDYKVTDLSTDDNSVEEILETRD